MKINTQGIARAPRRETKLERMIRIVTIELEKAEERKQKLFHQKFPEMGYATVISEVI